jgi:hypothetical protein
MAPSVELTAERRPLDRPLAGHAVSTTKSRVMGGPPIRVRATIDPSAVTARVVHAPRTRRDQIRARAVVMVGLPARAVTARWARADAMAIAGTTTTEIVDHVRLAPDKIGPPTVIETRRVPRAMAPIVARSTDVRVRHLAADGAPSLNDRVSLRVAVVPAERLAN